MGNVGSSVFPKLYGTVILNCWSSILNFELLSCVVSLSESSVCIQIVLYAHVSSGQGFRGVTSNVILLDFSQITQSHSHPAEFGHFIYHRNVSF